MYDRAVEFWVMLYNILGKFTSSGKAMSRMWIQFWGAHQRFFRQMLMAAKVPWYAAALV